MEGIPAATAAVLRPALPAVADEIIREIAREVPAYQRLMQGEFGHVVRDASERALRRFVDSIERPADIRLGDRRIYIGLGRAEHRQGRSLNALLAAYRVGAQVAWRRFVEAGQRADLDPQVMYRLGEAIFAYIDEISGESVEGYASEQSAVAGEQERRRAQLVALLAQWPATAGPDAIKEAARRVGWTPPTHIAALAVLGGDPDRLAGRLGRTAVATAVEPEPTVLAFVGHPDDRGARGRIEQAVGARRAVLGPTVAVEEAGRSADRALRVLRLVDAGVLGADGLLLAAEHAATLLLHTDPGLGGELAAARLGPLDELRPAARARLLETLRAWLDHQGRVEETAARLGVHAQTVRYRLGQLRDALGDALDDPESRFELELALRTRAK